MINIVLSLDVLKYVYDEFIIDIFFVLNLLFPVLVSLLDKGNMNVEYVYFIIHKNIFLLTFFLLFLFDLLIFYSSFILYAV